MLNKLERKLGKYAIKNLTLYLLICYAIGYVLIFVSEIAKSDFYSLVTLEPYLIIHNLQLWRLFSWVFIPPQTSVFWALFMFLLYYQLGNALERTWGTFRYNVYIFGGLIFTLIGAFLTYGIFTVMGMPAVSMGSFFSTYYINLSIFLAFATCYPDMQVMLYFIIPIKMKWMAIFYVVIIGFEVVHYIAAGAFYGAVPIIASLLNFAIFYFSTKNGNRINPKEIHRRNSYKRASTPTVQKVTKTGQPITRHRCVVCGRTEASNPELEFRFCSKCNGNYEYCQDHLFTHSHVK